VNLRWGEGLLGVGCLGRPGGAGLLRNSVGAAAAAARD
jgi:hypothetical protein